MPSDLHETIINEVRNIYELEISPRYGGNLDLDGVKFQIDPLFGSLIIKFSEDETRIPDFYMTINDGHGPILGEVGRMPPDKWGDTFSSDNLPVRVLRIGFDRSVAMKNPRFSNLEIEITEIFRDGLWNNLGIG